MYLRLSDYLVQCNLLLIFPKSWWRNKSSRKFDNIFLVLLVISVLYIHNKTCLCVICFTMLSAINFHFPLIIFLCSLALINPTLCLFWYKFLSNACWIRQVIHSCSVPRFRSSTGRWLWCFLRQHNQKQLFLPHCKSAGRSG